MNRGKKLFFGAALLLTFILLLGQIFHYPNSIRDIVTDQFPVNCSLKAPYLYIFFAPFFLLADHLTILSLNQHISFLVFVNLGWVAVQFFLCRGKSLSRKAFLGQGIRFLLFELGVVFIYAVVICVPRPMAKLYVNDPDMLVVDFHSHTQRSWDARRSFSVTQNLLWHSKAGFDAAFITDHNVFEPLVPSSLKGVNALKGEEVSLFKSHWVLLGVDTALSNVPYDIGMPGIENFVKEMKASTGKIVIASLPEYWLYHWGSDLESFAEWGINGFEIVNSAPRGLDFPSNLRSAILEICKKRNLVVTGISDNHGWGSACYAWNLMKIPQWHLLSQKDLESRIIQQLKTDGFNAVKVMVRVKQEPRTGFLGRVLDPMLQIWEASRALSLELALSCFLWIWGSFIFCFKCCIKSYNEA